MQISVVTEWMGCTASPAGRQPAAGPGRCGYTCQDPRLKPMTGSPLAGSISTGTRRMPPFKASISRKAKGSDSTSLYSARGWADLARSVWGQPALPYMTSPPGMAASRSPAPRK